jgi:hypothetical protein
LNLVSQRLDEELNSKLVLCIDCGFRCRAREAELDSRKALVVTHEAEVG